VYDTVRRAAVRTVLAATLSFGPSVVPPWRVEPTLPPAATLEVGEPMPWIFRTRLCRICRSQEDR
jgi:hypothetical protein